MAENFETQEITTTNTNAGIMSFTDTLLVDVTEQGYWSSFAVETMADKKKLYAARNDNELLRDHMGEVIEVADFVIDSQTISDPDVGARQVPCLHIIAKDGTCYQSSSSGVVKSACDIISSFGLPNTWGEDTISVACKETNTTKGFRYKYLTVVE